MEFYIEDESGLGQKKILIQKKGLDQKSLVVTIEGQAIEIDSWQVTQSHVYLEFGSHNLDILVERSSVGFTTALLNGEENHFYLRDYSEKLKQDIIGHPENFSRLSLKAPMPGKILKILVQAGQLVEKGQELLILEAMKMENVIKAPLTGKVTRIEIHKQDHVENNQILLEIEAASKK